MKYVCEMSFIGSVRDFLFWLGEAEGYVFHKEDEGHMGGESRGICLSLGR